MQCINIKKKNEEEHTVDLSMLIIIHRLRTIFYYLPCFYPSVLSLRNAFCVHQCKNRKTLFSDDKSYDVHHAFPHIFFVRNVSKHCEKMEFSCSMALSCITLGKQSSGGAKFIGLQRLEEEKKKCKHMHFLCGA